MKQEEKMIQDQKLKEYWLLKGGAARLAENFVDEMQYFLTRCPRIIEKSNKKTERIESENYSAVEKHCKKLILALEKIPEYERLGNLSVRERRVEYDNRLVPLCDPLDYVSLMAEMAGHWSYELKKFLKYERQLHELSEFIQRFQTKARDGSISPLAEITRPEFIALACILWPNVNIESFKKACKSIAF